MTAFLLAPGDVFAQAPSYEWVAQARLPVCCAIRDDFAEHLAVDAATNLYVCGGYRGAAIFGTNTLYNDPANGGAQVFLTKYDRDGNPLWVRGANNAGNSSAYSMGVGAAPDQAGNVYVAVNFGWAVSYSGYSFTTPSGAPSQAFLVKHGPNGAGLWSFKLETPGNNFNGFTQVTDIAVDKEGNLHVLGLFGYGTLTIGTITLSGASSATLFHAKFSPDGKPIWAQRSPYMEQGEALLMSLDDSGNSYVVGSFNGLTIFGTFVLEYTQGIRNVFLAKYDPNGNVVMARRVTGSAGAVVGYRIAVDPIHQVYLWGQAYNAVDFGTTNFASFGGVLDFLAKFSANGDLAWVVNTGTNYSIASATVDPAGNSFVAGFLPIYPGNGRVGDTNLVSRGGTDIFLARYDNLGRLSWVKQAGFVSDDGAAGVALDSGGNLYLTGNFSDTGIFDEFVLSGSGGPDLFLAKLPNVAAIPPRILTQPQAQAIPAGGTASFSVTATGTAPFSYQWRLFGIELPGATNGAFTLENAQPDREGNYTVVVSNSAGSVTSQVATLTVLIAPAIATQPASQTVVAGSTASLSVTVAGTTPLHYQWSLNGVEVAGATGATLLIPNVQPSRAGNYQVVITNQQGSVTSIVASLTVRFVLTAKASGPGKVTRSPDFPSYPPNFSVTLSPVADTGASFRGWSGDATGNITPLTITMTTNKVITANFAAISIQILIQGQGVVTKTPDKSTYALGDQVTLMAAPGRYYQFARWGDGFTNNPRLVTVGTDNTYTAIFSPTVPLETLTFGGVSRTAPVGTPMIFVDGEFIVSNSVTRTTAAQVALQTTFPNGAIFYTLDGKAPSFESALYDSPFMVSRSRLLRATAYTADFGTSREADPVEIIVPPSFSLTATSPGGGQVGLSPGGGVYISNTTVFVTATPAPGWTFLQWLGDVSGTNPAAGLVMTRDKCVRAVLGTTLGATVAGNGSVTLDPAAALYPWGAAVTAMALPQAGNYFVLWGNAASGSVNPLDFAVTNANPMISSAFAAVSSGQLALSVVPHGRGQVTVNPRANRYSLGTLVTLLAVPEAGQQFVSWTGDASGISNTLTVTMTDHKVVHATFTSRPTLSVPPCGAESVGDGFQVWLTGEIGARYRIDVAGSSLEWTPMATITNLFGLTQVSDPSGPSAGRVYRAVQLP